MKAIYKNVKNIIPKKIKTLYQPIRFEYTIKTPNIRQLKELINNDVVNPVLKRTINITTKNMKSIPIQKVPLLVSLALWKT